MFETRSRFDNRYVTKELQALDLKRQQQGKETVLPLNRRERAKYIIVRLFCLHKTLHKTSFNKKYCKTKKYFRLHVILNNR